MVETAVEQDDEWIEKFLEGEEPDQATLKSLIRKGTLAMEFFPMICGSAFKNKGVQPMLDAVVDYMPAPTDVEAINVRAPCSLSSSRRLRDRTGCGTALWLPWLPPSI